MSAPSTAGLTEEERLLQATAREFATRRMVGTGSWIGRDFQGRGFGKEMRAGLLTLAFDGLGAKLAETEIEKVGQRLQKRWLLGRHGRRFRLGREAQRELAGVRSCRSSHTGSPA